jgi:hypothetical protein
MTAGFTLLSGEGSLEFFRGLITAKIETILFITQVTEEDGNDCHGERLLVRRKMTIVFCVHGFPIADMPSSPPCAYWWRYIDNDFMPFGHHIIHHLCSSGKAVPNTV